MQLFFWEGFVLFMVLWDPAVTHLQNWAKMTVSLPILNLGSQFYLVFMAINSAYFSGFSWRENQLN